MSIRYKSALLSLVSLALVYGWYFAGVIADRHGHGQPARLVITVLLIAVVQIAGHIVIAVTARDRYGAMDERERAFDRRATGTGYYVLISGALFTAATLHLGALGPDMANAILLAVVVAEIVRQGVFLTLHHRAA